MVHQYIETIKLKYPDLTIQNYYPNEIGQNNDVLIINNSLVFRFPKYKQGISQLKKETELLEYIKNIITISIPNPAYRSFESVIPGEVFTGYKLITGVPLWKDSLQNIKSNELLKGLALQLVTFLVELHSIPKEKAKNDLNLNDNHPIGEMSNLFNRIQNKLFPLMRKEAQKEVIQSFKTFLNGEAALNSKTTLIHGDFGASNILWNPKPESISGIIDFGGSGLGDPAYDFAGILSSYGGAFFNMCIELYPNGNEISERVKFYQSTFALQEALHGLENNDQQAFENGIKAYR
ncbi:phosphotransferase family protein [Oceanobacillus neutriphilus]|uniref:6'-aminoglycoside N-acetyltransferase n=1 Tax=Oceanobacillus neutriphilus TaxID=531815 RepID=A0ABQ2NQ38_9BACI|nr:aminoglycoside phosphotransferase family protein [Oceanobacillus neutriphilus]GGP08986.1 6'-aminoglycoside N-acetyltransferase [Oceanobacillus neutriphilus]